MPIKNPVHNHVWWVKPNTLIGIGIIPLYILIGSLTDSYTKAEYWLALLLIFCFYLGSQTVASFMLGSKVSGFNTLDIEQKKAEQLLTFFFILSIIGYTVWFWGVIKNPSLIMIGLKLSQGQIFTLRGVLETTSGISTLAQFGIVYSALYAKLLRCNALRHRKRHLSFFVVIIFLASMRSLLWSERLALIEVICPFALIYIVSMSASKNRSRLIKVFPFLAALVIYAAFSVFEYFRSWRYYSDKVDNFFSFTLERLIKYYSSSVENGVAFLSWQGSPSYDGTMFLAFIYRLPYIGSILSSTVDTNKSFASYLYCCANPEFNLASWPFLIASDIGALLSMLFFYFIGVVFGLAYRGFIKSKASFMYYPVIYISLLELLRQHYLHNPRLTYVLVGALIVHIIIKRQTKVSKIRRALNGGF